MKSILVTGATGFIGNYVIDELLLRGIRVVATSRSEEKAASMPWYSRVKHITFDLNDFDQSVNYYQFFLEPDAVVHLAWEGLPNYKALFHFEKNLPLQYRFLKNIVGNGCRDLTITGTCFEYGREEGRLSEDMPTRPANSYALAKDCLYKFLQQYNEDNAFLLKWIRVFYLYGEGQGSNSLFSQLDKAVEANKPVFNMSAGNQIRDYLHIKTAAEYIVKTALQRRIVGAINCCSGNPVTVKAMVEKFLEEKQKKIKLNLGFYSIPEYEPHAFWGDNGKIQKILHEQ